MIRSRKGLFRWKLRSSRSHRAVRSFRPAMCNASPARAPYIPLTFQGRRASQIRHQPRRFRSADRARAAAQLRKLQTRAARRLGGGAHLLVRMHVLRVVRRARARQRLPQLRRWLLAAADPPVDALAQRELSGRVSRVRERHAPTGGSPSARAFLVHAALSAAGTTLRLELVGLTAPIRRGPGGWSRRGSRAAGDNAPADPLRPRARTWRPRPQAPPWPRSDRLPPP